MYDTQACTFGTVVLLMDKSLSMRSYRNRLSLFSMLGRSVFSLILRLSQWCGKQSGIDISLMMHNRFFVNFQLIGKNVLVFLCGYLFLSLILYNRCRDDFKPMLILQSTFVPCVGLHTLLNFLFSQCDFLVLSFFFNIDWCGSTLLSFWLVVELPRLKPHCRTGW